MHTRLADDAELAKVLVLGQSHDHDSECFIASTPGI